MGPSARHLIENGRIFFDQARSLASVTRANRLRDLGVQHLPFLGHVLVTNDLREVRPGLRPKALYRPEQFLVATCGVDREMEVVVTHDVVFVAAGIDVAFHHLCERFEFVDLGRGQVGPTKFKL